MLPTLLLLLAAAQPARSQTTPPPATETAVFAGGCFWGVDAVFKHVKGVVQVVSGYAGGKAPTAHYELVSTGETGHAESVEVTYDPAQVSYRQLLQVFFTVAHDP
ncbi:MAG TPA: peptide-methionine (S)-S-oxide reductase, partial [Gemmatimonadales bacterium]|nr:peptide-methionine (S)-S-oxide reductase [Gemmatimonadales bacterium]